MVTFLVPLPTLPLCVFAAVFVQTNQTGLPVKAARMLEGPNSRDEMFGLPFTTT